VPRTWTSTIVAALAVAGLLAAGCGISGDDASITHIRGSSATITKPMLDHWVRVVVANDFRAGIGTKGPVGFVSEPADYAECAQAAKKVTPRTHTGKLKLSDGQIEHKCQLLHRVVRDQAMDYLLSAQWAALQAKEQGVRLTEAELHREFLRVRKETYKTEANFQTFLKERRMSLSDVLYQLRRNLYVARTLPKLEARANAAGANSASARAKVILEHHNQLIARTSCKSGYVMEDCRGYRPPAKPLPSPDVVLEAIVQGIGSP
jgi:hypothetical protein